MGKGFGKQATPVEEKSTLSRKDEVSFLAYKVMKDLFLKSCFDDDVAFPLLERFIKLCSCKHKRKVSLVSCNY